MARVKGFHIKAGQCRPHYTTVFLKFVLEREPQLRENPVGGLGLGLGGLEFESLRRRLKD